MKIMFERSYSCIFIIVCYLVVTSSALMTLSYSDGTASPHSSQPMLLTLVQTYTYEKTKQKFHDHYTRTWPTVLLLWSTFTHSGECFLALIKH